MHQFQHLARRGYESAPTEESALRRLTEAINLFRTATAQAATDGRQLAIAFHLMGGCALSLAVAVAHRDRIPINVFDALSVAAFVSEMTEDQAVQALLTAVEAEAAQSELLS
jgi:hypothetical protein